MVDHRRRGASEGPFGPIRPEHACDGWELAGDAAEWWLTRRYGCYRACVTGTTKTTCAWQISATDGSMIREASARSVDDAKSAADAWVKEHLPPE